MSTETTPAEPPPSTRDRALAAVPVVLTVIATVLAGLSSSEMTQSMYYRSLAAQQQAKAGSQWAFFQAKRIRGTTMESSGDLIRALADPPALDPRQLRSAADRIESALRRAGGDAAVAADAVIAARQKLDEMLNRESVRQSLRFLVGSELPPVTDEHLQDPQLLDLVAAIQARKTEAQTTADVVKVPPGRIEDAIELV